jgi:hypothetical protein
VRLRFRFCALFSGFLLFYCHPAGSSFVFLSLIPFKSPCLVFLE